jgi:hypothetical protein
MRAALLGLFPDYRDKQDKKDLIKQVKIKQDKIKQDKSR